MGRRRIDVFLSYRHEGGSELAQGVRATLESRGLHVFLDVREMPSGPFPNSLRRAIEEAPNFVVLLTRGCLARCFQEDDWVRREIAHAIVCKRNIIPLRKADFEFPDGLSSLPDIVPLKDYHCFSYSHDYHDESINRICSELRNRARAERDRRGVLPASIMRKRAALMFLPALLVAILGSAVLSPGRKFWFSPPAKEVFLTGSQSSDARGADAGSGRPTAPALNLVGEVLENTKPFAVIGQIPRDYQLALVDGQNFRFVATSPRPAFFTAFTIGSDGSLERLESGDRCRTEWVFSSRLDDRPGTEFLCLATSDRPFTENDWQGFVRKRDDREELSLPQRTILYGEPLHTRVFGREGELTRDQLRNLIPGNASTATWWHRIETLRCLLRETFEDFRFLAFPHRTRTVEDP